MVRKTLSGGALSLVVAALCALSTIGCGGSDDTIDVTFAPCEPLILHPSQDATAEQIESIHHAAEMWNAVGADVTVATGELDGSESAVDIGFEDAAPMFFGIYRDERGDVVINSKVDDRDERAVVVAHEVGHAFGLQHVEPSRRGSVMNQGNVDRPPDGGDAMALEALWPECAMAD